MQNKVTNKETLESRQFTSVKEKYFYNSSIEQELGWSLLESRA
jgi:hypothetical protein